MRLFLGLVLIGIWVGPTLANEDQNGEELMAALIEALESDDPQRQMAAGGGVAVIGPAAAPAIDALIQLMEDEPVRRPHRKVVLPDNPATVAARALSRIGEPAIPALVEAAGDENATLRGNAFYVLASLGLESTRDALWELSRSENPESRRSALSGLMNGPERIEAFFAAASDESSRVRALAATQRFDAREDVRVELERLLEDENAHVRRMASRSLGRMGDAAAIDALGKRAADEHQSVRSDAAEALGALGDRRAVPHLLKFARDEQWSVRYRAAGSLGLLEDPLATPVLIELLDDEHQLVRRYAAGALGKIIDRRAVPGLIRLVETGDEVSVVAAAAGALGKIGGPDVVAPLIAALETNEVAPHAIAAALGELGDPATIDALGRFLHENPAAAATALKRIRGPRSVIVLADHLTREEVSRRDRFAIASALEELTGEPRLWDRARARAWWDENRERYVQARE